ncbi:hypothetical protein D9M72_500020 [compost metagenome]
MPLDVEVDRLLTLLFVVLSPDDVEADRLLTRLLAVLSPEDVEVDSDPTVLATEYNWLPLIASVEVEVTWPAATLVIWRSAPAEPTLTTLVGVAPANPPSTTPLTVALAVGTAAAVTLLLPSATLLSLPALAPVPIATAFAPALFAPPSTVRLPPMATLFVPLAFVARPMATACSPDATEPPLPVPSPPPTATDEVPLALASLPRA